MALRRSSVSFVYAAFVLFLLLSASAMGDGRTCESQSHRFRGPCVSKSNCGAVCRSEGFHWGHCRGFRRRCFCTKHC